MAEEDTEEPKEEPEAEEVKGRETGNIGNLFSPEGVIMLPLAVLLDLIGVILICLGLDDFFITDIVGILLIGGWMFLRSQTIVVPERAKQKVEKGLKKLFRGKWSKFLTPIIGELIPYVGALPCWTLAVYYELTS